MSNFHLRSSDFNLVPNHRIITTVTISHLCESADVRKNVCDVRAARKLKVWKALNFHTCHQNWGQSSWQFHIFQFHGNQFAGNWKLVDIHLTIPIHVSQSPKKKIFNQFLILDFYQIMTHLVSQKSVTESDGVTK